MTIQQTLTAGRRSPVFATKVLNGSAKLWFSIILAGQAMFAFYIVAFYYAATAANEIERFNQVMPAGFIAGEFWGNIAVIGHVLFAAIITVGGLLQLIPAMRNKFPAVHRWNGRLYVVIAIVMSLSGAFMIITRHDNIIGDWFGHLTLLINGALILICATMAFKWARQRQFSRHRVWALRLFVAVSGVWLFRVGLMAWLTVHGKPVGFDPVSFTGPFLKVLYTLVYIMPLLFLEVYLRAQSSQSVRQKLITATGVFLLNIILAVGVFAAIMGMWLPRI
ncbi:DUF2306 domain-containing protein [Marinicella sediminis]|uniref:DUF2306 domain-containing protein n=1 Tax=Marinicella sediminis TaxID=1792834 RepID=A0ABV7JAN3_9GAMM|nr:DUF2306 domain-containing protein [Marinicella sediminis]